MDMLITIEQPTTSTNAIREQVKSFSTYKSCYAERIRKPGGESIQAGQQQATMPVEYRIRHDANVVQTWRLFEGANTGANPRYYITDVQHWKREGFTLLTAERRDNA